MRTGHRKEWLRPALLGFVCIAFAGLTASEFETGVARPQVDADHVPPPPAITTASPPAPLPLARFSSIVERPLFTATRRPPEYATATEDAPPPRQLDVVLLGIIAYHDGAVALMQPKAGEVVPVREGQKVSGWKVERIQADRVFLQGERLEEVKLYAKTAAELSTVAKGGPPRAQSLSEWRAAQKAVMPLTGARLPTQPPKK
jgi:general secretion pathway protein N